MGNLLEGSFNQLIDDLFNRKQDCPEEAEVRNFVC